jgi:hypothetical protein
MNDHLWIIVWQDISGDPTYNHKEVAHSPERAVERIRVILSGETVVDEEAIGPDGQYAPEAERAAFDVLFEGEDPITTLREPKDEIAQVSDNGKIIVTRCWVSG